MSESYNIIFDPDGIINQILLRVIEIKKRWNTKQLKIDENNWILLPKGNMFLDQPINYAEESLKHFVFDILNRSSKIDNKGNQMRYSNVTNGRKRGIAHNKGEKVFGRENNGIEEGIIRNITFNPCFPIGCFLYPLWL